MNIVINNFSVKTLLKNSVLKHGFSTQKVFQSEWHWILGDKVYTIV